MRKKIFVVVMMLAGALCIMPYQESKAAELSGMVREGSISVLNLYSNTISTVLSINDGKAVLRGRVTGKIGTTTKIHMKLILQKYSGGVWKGIQSFEKTDTTTSCTLSSSKAVTSGKYRVKGIYTVYKGKKFEKTTQYSSTISY